MFMYSNSRFTLSFLPPPLPFSLPLSLLSSQEVDGESLLSLDPQMMVKLMDLKTGPALRIHRKIATLKRDIICSAIESHYIF